MNSCIIRSFTDIFDDNRTLIVHILCKIRICQSRNKMNYENIFFNIYFYPICIIE
ncbi:hypothetical protein PSM36_3039 [Proteiniphilum saccharofermentans]|uniref:Uncharacterized protein n=1 Tax=Proteiniphilum saccharofermentans TaxID=1642647 RepID=A0A1R3T950_9BACT|nr:hypothetical protein PSM36_3039 [Proteiniphilum saccharofermentans]